MCLLTHQWLYTDHHRSSAMSTWIERNGDSVSLRLAENYRVSGNRKHQNHQCNTLIIRFIQYRTDTILIHTLYFKWQIHTPPPHIHTQTRPEVMIRWWTRWMCATCHFNATTIKSSALLMFFFLLVQIKRPSSMKKKKKKNGPNTPIAANTMFATGLAQFRKIRTENPMTGLTLIRLYLREPPAQVREKGWFCAAIMCVCVFSIFLYTR